VLATSIAETSLTIEGIRIVVDSGFSRVPRFSPRTGMTRLETVRVTRAAADQRHGRAGRLGPGICYRLWTEIEQAQLVPHGRPEILEADLAPLALELAIAGIADPLDLAWLDPPPPAALAQAHELLRELEAIDGTGRATSHGQAIAALGVHPRFAHMLLRARALGYALTACAVAALLGERDLLRGETASANADLRGRLEAIVSPTARDAVDRATLHRVRTEMERLARALDVTRTRERLDPAIAGVLIAFAYPDRIGKRRGAHGRYVLRNGRGATLDTRDPLGNEELLAVAAIDGREPDSRIFLAAPLTRDELEASFGEQILIDREISWDAASDSVVARRRERLGAIVLADHPLADPDPVEVAAALVRALAAAGVDALPWSDGARRLRERMAFLHQIDPTWPDVSDVGLATSIEEWLAPRVIGMRRRAEVSRLDLGAALLERLDWRQRTALDELAPTHLVVPSGSRIPIDYSDPELPVLAVRLQEMFGLPDTPRIAGGRVPLTLHLLSPAQRPVQVTRDLAGFWRSSYFDVQRELRGRYPKHDWPDDPLAASPTSRAKRRSR
jgi:ATP-dependent helicase HrpB